MNRVSGIDQQCNRCSLSCPPPILGQSEVKLSDCLLIYISAYPGTEEIKKQATLVPAGQFMNAGGYLQGLIQQVFDRDPNFPERWKPFNNWVYKTNALKCPPKGGDITSDEIKACRHWLDLELDALPPKIPIVLAASQALQSLTKETSLNGCRGRTLSVKGRPAITTLNPIEGEKYTPKVMSKGVLKGVWPPIVGSIPWLVLQDMEAAKGLVLEYLSEQPTD